MLPFARPEISDYEIEAVAGVLKSGLLSTGIRVSHFEQCFARAVGARQAVAVDSATNGLYLSLVASGITSGEVITTPWTFTATAEAIERAGCTPRFVDIDPVTLNFDLDLVAEAINENTRAILPVHMAGLAVNLTQLYELAKKHNLVIIEDAAHALGSKHMGKPIGSFKKSAATVFSFYATKPLCTGEGGMICTGDDALAARLRRLRLHGITRTDDWEYEVTDCGIKANMTDLEAAIGSVQLRRYQTMQARRKAFAEYYLEAFNELELVLPAVGMDEHSWHLFVVQVKNRNPFIKAMRQHGIQCGVHYKPLHLHKYWSEKYNLTPDSLPKATAIFQQNVSLPLYSAMTIKDVNHVSAVVIKLLT
ncbi:MAG: DegT/DnrJ/EryC1/StrS family aminotransferase [Stenomitos frigidus ULC029]